jgi:hypothetical protein
MCFAADAFVEIGGLTSPLNQAPFQSVFGLDQILSREKQEVRSAYTNVLQQQQKIRVSCVNRKLLPFAPLKMFAEFLFISKNDAKISSEKKTMFADI